MRAVAFLRNVNQGQRGSPSTSDIVAAFVRAGAAAAEAFQSNGTIVVTSDDPDVLAELVRDRLLAAGGTDMTIFARPLSFVEGIVGRHADAADFSRRELTLFASDRDVTDPHDIAARRRCTLIEHGIGWAVVSNERDRESNGTPTIEQILSTPATSRGLPTLLRLVDRFGHVEP